MIDKKWFTPVRFSHLTSHAAVGSIVRDQNDWLMRVKDTRHWPVKSMPQLHAVERVKQHLQIHQRLLLPPTAEFDESKNLKIHGATIPTDRFPSWMKCNQCDRLFYEPWSANEVAIDEQINCQTCKNGILEQLTWCATSSFGDLVDVPWHKICHRNSQKRCIPVLEKSYLKVVNGDKGKKAIKCENCGSKADFEYANFKLKEHFQVKEKVGSLQEEAGITYTVMEVNDPRVYSPQNERALVIPPESSIDRNSLKYKLELNLQLVNEIKGATRGLQRKKLIKRATSALNCTESELIAALDDEVTADNSSEIEIVAGDMLGDEYLALITPEDFPEGADFITRHLTPDWLKYIDDLQGAPELQMSARLVDRIVAIDRLRVIEVFKGFSRAASDIEEYQPVPVVPPDLVNKADWLPAIELFGEGIFFTLNGEKIKEWESNQLLRQRASVIEQRYQNSNIILPDDATPSPRFIMLHTLAHILIRELESTAGYPAASLQERIYCSPADGMAGILIYTAVADVAGSLGGIVELARPDKFLRLFDAALRQANWCSLDPVCGEMEGQGPAWLNRAACHACALVPDTACSYKNVFLDRVFIKGNSALGIPSLIDVMRNTDGKTNF